MVLHGWEVKSLRMGKADLGDSYVLIKDGEAFLLGSQIVPLETASTHFVTDPTRTRKLLLHKSEINKLSSGVLKEHLTIIPLKMFFNPRGRVKVDIALARGKKLHDKREGIKEREAKRDIDRAMSRRR